MKISIKARIKKIGGFFKKFSRVIGEHFFLSFLFIVMLAIILGAFIFYKYVFLPENVKLNILERPVFFNTDVYRKVLEELQNREKVIQELDSKQYSNPFEIPTPVPEILAPAPNESSPAS